MILRRIAENLRQQHWTGVFIELAIVVLGVFIGLQVSNWNTERGEKAAEVEYLAAMKADVDYSIGKLERLLRNLDEAQAARKKLFEFATEPAATLAPAERDRALLFGLFQLPMLDISEVTFEILKSSGRLSLIRSPALVSELQSLSANVANALSSQADELQVTYLFSDPLLMEHVDMAGVFRQPNLDGTPSIAWLKTAPASAAAPPVMKTQRFANALLYRTFFADARLANIRKIHEQHQRIVALIKARQDELGVGR